MRKYVLMLLLGLLTSPALWAQRTVTGSVTDGESGESLVGVAVLAKGTTVGMFTDENGKYALEVPDNATVLVFSLVGMSSVEETINGRSTISVSMNVDALQLEEVVVTAMGISKEKIALGYAVQDVSGDALTQTNTVSAIDALSGKAAGVQITSASGAAGAGSRVVMRGQTSFNGNNEALIVIDGIRVDNSENTSERELNGVANSNRGIDINPDDIASITVLKGGAAAALYGSEGARGVLLITTKKGRAGKGITVDLKSTYTLSQVNKFHPLQNDFVQGYGEIWAGAETGTSTSWGPKSDTLFWDGATDYAWDKNGQIVGASDPSAKTPFVPYDNVGDLYQNGNRWQNNVSLSGGTNELTYRLSFGRTDESGVTPNNTFSRTNLSLSTSSKMFDNRLTIDASINYVNSGGQRIQQGSNTSGLNLGLLRSPISFDNANGLEDPVNDPSSYQFPDGRQRNYRGGGGYDNPYWVVNNSPFVDLVNRAFGSLNATYRFDKWFALNAKIGGDFYTDNRKQEFEIGSRTFPGGQVIEDQWNYSHTDIYLNALGGGDISSKFGFTYNVGANFWNKFQKNNYVQGDGFNFVGFRNLSNAQSVLSVIDHTPERNVSFFGNLDFSYDNLLYLTVTGRQDYLSSLIDPAREFKASDIGVFYPSASLSFVFSELFAQSNVFSFGKARASFAQIGGGAPNPFLTSTIFNVPNNSGTIYSLNDGWTNGIFFPYQGLSGFTYSPLAGNATLVPSTTTDLEFGLDLRFFEARVGLDLTFYTRKSENQIIPINVPSSTGFQRAVLNSGSLATMGSEVILRLVPFRSKDLNWEMNLNFSNWRTIVESLPPGVPNQYLDGFTGTGVYNIAPLEEEGAETVYYEYGQILGGAFQHANTPAGNSFDASLPYNPAGALIIDDSGSPDPDSDEYNINYGYPLADPVARVIGNPNPDFLLGINSDLTWKNLSFSFLFDIRHGGDMWNGTKGALTFFGRTELTADRDPTEYNDTQGDWVHAYAGDGKYTYGDEVFEGVKASDGSANDIGVPLDAQWYLGNGGGFGSVDEHFIENSSSYRLRFVSLGYDLGDKIKGVSRCKLTFTGRNLLMFTPYTGFDPESSLVGSSSNGQGLEYFQMPGTKSYAFGVQVTF